MLNDNGLDPDHSGDGVVVIPAMVAALIPAAISMPTPVVSVTAIAIPVVAIAIVPTPISIFAPVPALVPVPTVTLAIIRALILVVGAVILAVVVVILAVVVVTIVTIVITAALPISVAVENLAGVESSRQEIHCFAGIEVPGVGVDPEEDEGLADVVVVGGVGRGVPCKADILIAEGCVVEVEGLDQRGIVPGQFPNY